MYIMLYIKGDKMNEDIKIGFYLKATHNIIDKKLNEVLSKHGITRTQADILMYIKKKNKKNEKVNQRDIEKAFDISNPTVVGILNRLEEKEYIKREIDLNDSRNKNIVISKKFNDIADRIKDLVDTRKEKFFKDFTSEEIETLNSLLSKFYNNLQKNINEEE